MRATGIIAEYNPFHTGHAYHIQKARELTGADYIIVAMSPDFVQRGEPAIFDKYIRTECALCCGADLVLELPAACASGSAEYFAEGAVSLLSSTGLVDALCFGAETADAALFEQTAAILVEEPEDFRAALQSGLRNGLSFPAARAAALTPYCPEDFLASPNNILGIEYCKAIKKLGSGMQPLPLEREGSGYHSDDLSRRFCSASAIRRYLEPQRIDQDITAVSEILRYIPEEIQDLFLRACAFPITIEDFRPQLFYQLMMQDQFDHILDISPDLSDRIQKMKYQCLNLSYKESIATIRTKQFTESRISRALLHLILQLDQQTINSQRENQGIYYARILGFRKDSSDLLHELKKRSTVPLLTKTAHASSLLDRDGLAAFEKNIGYSHLYRSVRSAKYQIPFITEYQISPVIL